jgi:DNA-binding transcriptional regulator YdaS (Cro superfamily)
VQDARSMTLRRAADIVGGEEALALHLGVTPSHLALWLKSIADTPDTVFLRAVDIVQKGDMQPPPNSAGEVTQPSKDLKPD